MGKPALFSGTTVKLLKSILDLNGGAQLLSSATDPTSVAVSAPKGSCLFNTSTGFIYVKQDAGSSTNWTLITGPSSTKPTLSTASSDVHTGGCSADGTGTYTVPANVLWIEVELQGPGGGGGGCDTGGGSSAGAGGGGGGAYTRKLIVSPSASYGYVLTAGGAGGAAGNNNGATGTTATFGTAFLSCTGGTGGFGSPATTLLGIVGGFGGTASGGDVNVGGNSGYNGFVLNAGIASSGAGGSSHLGGGGGGRSQTSGAGNAGSGYGGGGGGGAQVSNGGTFAGADGSKSFLIITEHYNP